MVSLYRDPKGEKIFQKSNPTAETSSSVDRQSSGTFSRGSFRRSFADGGAEKVAMLNNKVQKLEEIIHEKEKKITELEHQLLSFKVSLLVLKIVQYSSQ